MPVPFGNKPLDKRKRNEPERRLRKDLISIVIDIGAFITMVVPEISRIF